MKKIKIYAPVDGVVRKLSYGKDAIFSKKILGDGCVIIPTDNKIYAPVTGKIGAMVDTGHAVGFISEDGVEVLVHIGMDTVNYEKDYFHLEKKVGDYVQAGDVIGHFDLKTLIYDERNVKTPVVIPTKKDKIKINLLKEGQLIWKQKLWKLYFNNIKNIKNNENYI